MIRSRLMTLAVTAVALAAAACGKDGGDTTGPAPAAETGTITLLNQSNTVVVAVSIPTCEDAEWGDNRLGGLETIAPGASHSWTVETGCYDMRASNGSKAAYWYDIQVTTGNNVEISVPAGMNASVVGIAADRRAR
jgi:hypothetical protein